MFIDNENIYTVLYLLRFQGVYQITEKTYVFIPKFAAMQVYMFCMRSN